MYELDDIASRRSIREARGQKGAASDRCSTTICKGRSCALTAREVYAAVSLVSFATVVEEPVSTIRTSVRILLTISDILYPHGEIIHFLSQRRPPPGFLSVLPLSSADIRRGGRF